MTNRATGITRTPRDETLEILRRIEPAVSSTPAECPAVGANVEAGDSDVSALRAEVNRLAERLATTESELWETKARIASMPTIWQVTAVSTGIVFAILGSAGALVTLIRFAAGGP